MLKNKVLNMKLNTRVLMSLVLILFLTESSITIAQNVKNNTQSDTQFTELFQRNCCGITGVDGIYSVLLPNGNSLWIFGDTFLGTVNEDGSRDKIDPVFIRNSVAVQSEFELKTFYGKTGNRDASFLIPPNAPVGEVFSEDSLWFWPGDAYVEGNEVKIFLSSFYQKSEGGWGFQWTGTWVASIDYETLDLISLNKIEIPTNTEIHWGHAVCDKADDFLYVYGLGSGKPYVARIAKDIDSKSNVKNADNWMYYDGNNWTKNINDILPMNEFSGSEQFSVFKLEGKFVYLSQAGGFSDEIYALTSSHPYGPWSKAKKIYKVPAFENKNLFPYNALAHPQFTNDGKLLISFCVNSFELEDVFEDADNYRPRFVRIPISDILEK